MTSYSRFGRTTGCLVLCAFAAAAEAGPADDCRSPDFTAAASIAPCTAAIEAATDPAERADLLLWRGSSHRSLDQIESALADFAAAAALQPAWADPLVERAHLFKDMGDLDAAVAELARARALDPDSAYAVVESINILPDAGLLEECLSLIYDGVRLASDDPYFFAYAGRCQYDAGQAEVALENFRVAISMGLEEAYLRANTALALLDLGRADQAVKEARAAVALDATDDHAQRTLLMALLANGDTDGALAAWRLAEPQIAGSQELLTNTIAWGLYKAGRAPEGLEIVEGWLAASPEPIGSVDLADTYAHLLVTSGRAEEAVTAFLKAVGLGGDERRALYEAGLARLGIPSTDLPAALRACAATGGACRLVD